MVNGGVRHLTVLLKTGIQVEIGTVLLNQVQTINAAAKQARIAIGESILAKVNFSKIDAEELEFA